MGAVANAQVLIEVRGLTKSFIAPDRSEFKALGPVDLTINAGEFVCIVGPSGCGKSTLLRILAGLDQPSGGELIIHAEPDETRPLNSMVFQGDSTFPWLTVHENIAYGLRVRGVGYREREETVARMLKTVGLGGFAESYPYQLSGGMRQRVALARALANDPAIYLMDEPFGALDAQNRIILQDELLQIWEQTTNNLTPVDQHAAGDTAEQSTAEPETAQQRTAEPDTAEQKTVVFITHSIDEAIVLADRVLVMSSVPGRIKANIPVPFARPRRTYELKRNPQFGELTYTIWEALRDEVNAARQAEIR